MDTSWSTLGELLRLRARHQGVAIAYEFLCPDGTVDEITYKELYRRATSTARGLEHLPDNHPVLILYPPGIDYVVAVWTCLIAGIPAIPAYPPAEHAVDRSLARLTHLVTDSGAAAVLAPEEHAVQLASSTGVLAGLPTLAVRRAAPGHAGVDTGPMPAADPNRAAIIQYTSGSTGRPRGVVLTQHNLCGNLESIRRLFALDTDSRAFVWLPPYHDMGLIGGVLAPLFVGFPARLMSPLHFVKSPSTWLTQLSETRATVSGGPNFGYDLAVRRFRGEVGDLDLSSWRVAFNGAEPIRRRTLAAFSERFVPAGFQPDAFLPCYGLAEATLLVTGGHWTANGTAGAEVSCGPPASDQHVVMAAADTLEPVADGVEGEILVHGAGVSPGYWTGAGNPPSREAIVSRTGKDYLRTGDLGVLRGGELYVRGRRKDVVVKRGRNFHASDIEEAAVRGDARLSSLAAAFSIDSADEDALTVLVVAQQGRFDRRQAETDIRTRVLGELGLRLDHVVIVPQRLIPRTTSGKVQRGQCRSMFEAGEFDQWLAEPPAPGPATPTPLAGSGDPSADLTAFLAGVFGVVCDTECTGETSLFTIGGDSLKAAEVAAIVEDLTGLDVPVDIVLTTPTPVSLARQLLAGWATSGVEPVTVVTKLRAAAECAGRTW